jgi:hypothetical protein
VLAKSTVPYPFPQVFITHPITNETWDIAPLLQLIYQLGSNNPALVAEAIFDVNHYITAEQHSNADTAERLRKMVRRISELGVAFDNIQVHPPSGSPIAPMQIV